MLQPSGFDYNFAEITARDARPYVSYARQLQTVANGVRAEIEQNTVARAAPADAGGLQSVAREVAVGAITENAVAQLALSPEGRAPEGRALEGRGQPPTLAGAGTSVEAEEPELRTRKFYVDGEAHDLLSALTLVLSTRVKKLEDSVQDYLNEMQAQNRMAEVANDYLAALRSYRPQEASGDADVTALLNFNTEFLLEHGIDPKKEFGLESFNWEPPLKQSEIDQMIEATRSKISSYNSTQDLAQLKLQRFNNNRNEAISLMSNLDKSFTELAMSIIRNIQ